MTMILLQEAQHALDSPALLIFMGVIVAVPLVIETVAIWAAWKILKNWKSLTIITIISTLTSIACFYFEENPLGENPVIKNPLLIFTQPLLILLFAKIWQIIINRHPLNTESTEPE